MHIFAFHSERICINLTAASAVPAPAAPAAATTSLFLPGASCPPLSPPPPFSLLFVDCCLQLPLSLLIFVIVTVAIVGVVVVIVIAVPVAVVDNNAVPDPTHVVVFVANWCCHCCPDVSSATTAVVSAPQRPLLPPSMWSLFLQLLPFTIRHGHDLLLHKSLF